MESKPHNRTPSASAHGRRPSPLHQVALRHHGGHAMSFCGRRAVTLRDGGTHD